MERERLENSFRKKPKKITMDTMIKYGVGLIILLLVVILCIMSEQGQIEKREQEQLKKEIALLMEDIQRNESSIAVVSKDIDTIKKVIKLNEKKEKHFNVINNQLEKASKNIPKSN